MADRTCGQWTSDKAQDSWQYTIDQAWVGGVLSGYNAARGGDIPRSARRGVGYPRLRRHGVRAECGYGGNDREGGTT
ncbi:MAG: hypothetical protein K2P68_05740, partial [Sphingomonas sp.]|nr:hypothetical protein [Sphingomonas sp.]